MELDDYKFLFGEIGDFLFSYYQEEKSMEHLNKKIESILDCSRDIYKNYKSVSTRQIFTDAEIAHLYWNRDYHMKSIAMNILDKLQCVIERKIKDLETIQV
jgi:hypothetical protein